MINTALNTTKLNKAVRLRNILIACGICILLTVVMHIFAGPFNLLYEGIETLLGMSSLMMGFKQNKIIHALRNEPRGQ